MKNVACLLSDRSRMGEYRIPRSGDALGRESASQGANGQAYAPSEVSGILFFKIIKLKARRHSFLKSRKIGDIPSNSIKSSSWFSGEVTWTAIGWVVDTEPGFISSGRIRKGGAGTATEIFPTGKYVSRLIDVRNIKIFRYVNIS